MTRKARRQYCADLESDAADGPRGTDLPAPRPSRYCAAALGRGGEHAFVNGRCLYCCKTREEAGCPQ